MEKDYVVARKKPAAVSTGVYASELLQEGHVYTRNDLRDLFSITASSINNGIFKPSAFDSVWLFVTEQKTADRTQYDDLLTGDILHMEGQTQGGTDHLLEEHVERGLELLLFYRKNKFEHPGAGFTYKGKFLYQSRSGSLPTSFTLIQASSPTLTSSFIEAKLQTAGEFNPKNIVDARTKVLASIVRRKGQSKFRSTLLRAYNYRCAVTGCEIEALLEAAHIVPYQGADTNVVSNGLLLRADIHTLFDLGLCWVDPTKLVVKLAEGLEGSEYEALRDQPISLPEDVFDRPNADALRWHFNALKSY
ncbi:HNH endonuclease [Pseudomonas sp. CFBP 13711]|uniref:HNH endonuclease n=1 Tax=unclassified Pseudomonas TaxID=196821 RepID=UPI001786F7FF|nr:MULTISPECIES: HNH endonuclease [unclassified Pseudomonas]MBD8709753.1 HNH endonuclease [Pseudomonas sp. CFBP 13711]MBD8711359.1 HNH endonuclease [Pseudomonas sp. CFBP 13715]